MRIESTIKDSNDYQHWETILCNFKSRNILYFRQFGMLEIHMNMYYFKAIPRLKKYYI